ncbi:hypothetical protein DSO57_1016404, partial [Entomophthora muscae]
KFIFIVTDVLNNSYIEASKIFAILLTDIEKFEIIYTELKDYCHAYIKNPFLKLPRLVPTAPEKEDLDSIYIGTLNAQGFATEECLTVYAKVFQSLGLSIVGITKVKKETMSFLLNPRFTWYEEPVTYFDGRKATAKLYFNGQYLFDFCVEYQPVTFADNTKYNFENAATATATKTCSVADRNGVLNVANNTIGQKAKKRATTKPYTSCMIQRNLEDVLEDGTQTKDDMSCYQFPRTEADNNPSSQLDTITATPRLKYYLLRPFTCWCRHSDHKMLVVEYKVKKFMSELTPTNSADTSAASF